MRAREITHGAYNGRDTFRLSMLRGTPFALLVSLVAAIVLVAGAPRPAHADEGPPVEFLTEKLKHDDFRVRFNAALKLGGKTGDEAPRAVAPLCGALGDDNDVVRKAASTALKRLGRTDALPCLKSRLAKEPKDDVKLDITRAIEAIEAAGGGNSGGATGGPPANNPNARYYYAYGISNNSGRSNAEIESLLLPRMNSKLTKAGTFQYAPPNETPAAAKAVMAQRHLGGLYVSISVNQIQYVPDAAGGLMLKIKLSVAVSTYPGKALKGGFDKGVGSAVSHQPDKASEDMLIGVAAESAFEQLAQSAQMFL
jgi:hypothetical protein